MTPSKMGKTKNLIFNSLKKGHFYPVDYEPAITGIAGYELTRIHYLYDIIVASKTTLNGWQLAKMKKSIPDMSLSWNL